MSHSPFNIGYESLCLLRLLLLSGAHKPTDAARELAIGRALASVLLGRLLLEGFVSREAGCDSYAITDKGKSFFMRKIAGLAINGRREVKKEGSIS